MADESRDTTRDSLDERIRRCIREELNNTSAVRNSNQTLVGRTRDLIRSSASFASRQLNSRVGEALPVSNRQNSNPSHDHGYHDSPDRSSAVTMVSESTKTERSYPSHPLRFPKRKPNVSAKNSSKKKKQSIPKTVYLLDEISHEDMEVDHEYAIKDEMILLKGEFDLECDADEASIRSELRKVFLTKFPLIRERYFDFVKRDHNTICTPVVKGHNWDYAHVKHLCGAGKLYVRLNISKDVLMEDFISQSDLEAEQPTFIDLSLPSTSSGTSSVDSKIASLTALFPNAQQSDLTHAVTVYDNLDLAANYLSEIYAPGQAQLRNVTCVDSDLSDEILSVTDILGKLKKKMHPYCTAEKIKVDRDDLVMDVFQHYKDGNFDPKLPIKFQIRGEPAVDAGGVLRQVYEDVFLNILKGDCGFQMFQGPSDRVIPTYQTSTILSGSFEILGKILAHSLVQGGPGFPYLCPTLYWYIATGDLQQGLARASCIDILDPVLAEYVRKVRIHFIMGTLKCT